MASEDVDIAQLTNDQQSALQQYTSVTDQDLAAAVQLLRRCEWNVQIAIARFFDGDSAVAVQEDVALVPPPNASRRQEVLLHSLAAQRPSTLRHLEAAPRISASSESQQNPNAGFLLSLLLTPANVLYSLFSRAINLFSQLFPFLPRLLSRIRPNGRSTSRTNRQSGTGGRRPLGPQDTTARFLRELEEDYGANNLPFLVTGYARAFDLAKRDLKFLLVVPISSEHDDTASFVRDVLLSDTVTTFLNDPSNNTLLWAGSVQDSEAYQVTTSLNINTFPSAILIAHTPSVSSTAMSIVARISGPTSPEALTAAIAAAIRQHSDELNRVRATRAEQDASRMLREQQNSAYERSLAADRERARVRREAESARQKEEAEQKQRRDEKERYEAQLHQWREWRAGALAPEPDVSAKDVVRINVRLLNGERVTRSFSPDIQMEEIYAFVECYDIFMREKETELSEKEGRVEAPAGFQHVYRFKLVSPLPRQVFEVETGGRIRDKIGRSGNLLVERLTEDADKDDAEPADTN